jgi:ribosomal protein S18 acetylase RimI-like enzyme
MQFAAQKQHYAAEHPRADHHVIYRDGIPVGRIYVDRTGENFHVLDITVLPQHRKGGAGTHVLRQLMDEAAAAGKAVTIYVESFNPSLALFHALGFQKVADREFHWLLSWSRTD